MAIEKNDDTWRTFKYCLYDYHSCIQKALYFLLPNIHAYTVTNDDGDQKSALIHLTELAYAPLEENRAAVFDKIFDEVEKLDRLSGLDQISANQLRFAAGIAHAFLETSKIIDSNAIDKANTIGMLGPVKKQALYSLALIINLDILLADCRTKLLPEAHRFLWSGCVENTVAGGGLSPIAIYLPYKYSELSALAGKGLMITPEETQDIVKSYSTENIFKIASEYPGDSIEDQEVKEAHKRYPRTAGGETLLLI